MQYLYTILLYLATPFLLLRLFWRGRKNPAYRQRWPERFGVFPTQKHHSIWLHAVSLGETIAATPLIKALLVQYPNTSLVVTSTTPTGSAQVLKQFGTQVYHVYAPYDLPLVIRRFIRKLNPRKVIIMETELWPNLLRQLQLANIPIMIANARLSQRSYLQYRRVKFLFKPLLYGISLIAAQSNADAERFRALGANPQHIMVTGNIKFDIEIPPTLAEQAKLLRQHWLSRPTWIAASTHETEETQVLRAYQKILAHFPNALLILVPRHPERFDRVAKLCLEAGYQVAARSKQEIPSAATQIYLGDTTGELMLLYACSDVAFVGGSLVGVGGHNLIEPASLGLAVLTGPCLDNFIAVKNILLQGDALLIVNNADELAAAVTRLFKDATLCRQYGDNALQMSEQNRGAVAKHLNWINR